MSTSSPSSNCIAHPPSSTKRTPLRCCHRRHLPLPAAHLHGLTLCSFFLFGIRLSSILPSPACMSARLRPAPSCSARLLLRPPFALCAVTLAHVPPRHTGTNFPCFLSWKMEGQRGRPVLSDDNLQPCLSIVIATLLRASFQLCRVNLCYFFVLDGVLASPPCSWMTNTTRWRQTDRSARSTNVPECSLHVPPVHSDLVIVLFQR